jgi:HEAT repeat protein
VDLQFRAEALRALETLPPDPRALDSLIALLRDEQADLRQSAIRLLGRINDPRAIEAILIASADPSPAVRRAAAEALGLVKEPRALPTLLPTWKEAVGKRKVREEADALIELAQRPSAIQEAALAALGEIGEERAK